jgi:hypothetical protein
MNTNEEERVRRSCLAEPGCVRERRAQACREAPSICALRKAYFPSQLAWAVAPWAGLPVKRRR